MGHAETPCLRAYSISPATRLVCHHGHRAISMVANKGLHGAISANRAHEYDVRFAQVLQVETSR